jgi:hypothetical protein
MAKIIDLTNSDGDYVILGRALVLPNATVDSQPHPLNGSLRFNPAIGSPQFFHDGAWITLGSGGGTTPTPGDGTSNNHTHTIAQITGLQNILNGKAPLVHSHTMSDIADLTATLANKSNIGHGHTIADINNLGAILDGKSSVGHTHGLKIKDSITAYFPASPSANYKLIYLAALGIQFPVNFVGSFIKVGTPPATTYTISLFKNVSTAVGSLIFYPNGNITAILANGLVLAAGDTLTFQCPARDTSINSISVSLLGVREPQNTDA